MTPLARLCLLLSLLCVSLVARADDVPPPPADCPPGSFGFTNHGGPYCAPLSCTLDADCKGGATCQSLSLCVATESYTPGRRPDETPRTRSVVSGSCDDKKSCAAPASCQPAKYCAPAPAPKAATPPAEAPAAKSCAVAPAEGGLSLLWLGLLLSFSLKKRIA